MYKAEWNKNMEGGVDSYAKLDREQKKNLEAVARYQKASKAEAVRSEIKAKAHQKETILCSKPRKQPKNTTSTDIVSNQSLREQKLLSNSVSQHEKLSESEETQAVNVINPQYKLTDAGDLLTHLMEYRETSKKNLSQQNQKQLSDFFGCSSLIEDIDMASEQFMVSTNQAFSKIKQKFEEGRLRLKKPNSKEHKQFQVKFLTQAFLSS